MRKLMLAIFGSALVAAASAQSPSPTPAATPDEARAARQNDAPSEAMRIRRLYRSDAGDARQLRSVPMICIVCSE